MVSLGARAPQHVYSVVITNKSSTERQVKVTYKMPPNGVEETLVLTIPPNGSKRAERRLVAQDLMKLTARVSSVALQGGNTLTEPFRGVFSPVEGYSIVITSDGVLQS
eukprot:CAMPEP_0176422158 /NCGR_PEP_ID=MMETSP0127-20121128/9581_1 /TAXON_ID=938130 /ORGANISM="Platyophrya macrostoma, Strain WH" /LENGTH=107 /DNA_ID=CAMNT_0017802983 /DNA_START=59 /DNA_END=382 /DNA_ORIENTATION=+